MLLTINFLHFRRNTTKMLCYFLNRITDAHKAQIKLHFLTHTLETQPDQTDWNAFFAANLDAKIAREIVRFPYGFNYMEKIRWGIEHGGEFSMKLDEDCLFSNCVWDFIIDNLGILDRSDVLFLSPALSIGIPTVEMFATNHLTKEEQDELYKIFLSTKMLDRWGAVYSGLNKHTTEAREWHHHEYYGAVGRIDHPYKGVHPVRQSYRAQKFMFKVLLEKAEQFKAPQDYRIVVAKYPYFCNSVFVIRTGIYKRIVDNPSLYVDSFEEVPLNKFCDKYGKNQAFIENAMAIHCMYGDALVDESTKDDNPHQAENDFYAEFERRVCV